MEERVLFISHSSKDLWLVSPFIEKILNIGLEIPREKIFFTSEKDTGIKSGQDFKRVIRENLQNAKAVIQIITQNYKESEVCLNEMGAAWVLSENVIPFIHHPIRFDNVGFLHNTTQLLKINNEEDLFQFQDDHAELNGGKKIKQSNYHRQVKEFLEIISKGSYGYGGINRW